MDEPYDSEDDPAKEDQRVQRVLQKRIMELLAETEELRAKVERHEAAAAAAPSSAARAISANRERAADIMPAPEYDAEAPQFASDEGRMAFLDDYYQSGAAVASTSADNPPSEKTIKLMKLLRIPDGIIRTVKTQADASRWIKAAKESNAKANNPCGLRDPLF